MQPTDQKIIDHSIEEEMKTSYLNFALSVIINRALPDVRDGLKPVQRRILVAMDDLNLGPRAKHRKCAKIIGDTEGNYHPHGGAAIYQAAVRMAQPFNFRYPLIDGQGNFGSLDGDPAAAMRYTEARLTAVASEMLADLNLDTVDFRPNYEETRTEPVVLPGRFPNLLCNGTSGIAVGMASNIPPHNLNEICDAIIRLLDDPDVELDELMKIVKGPDYPGGAMICGRSGIRRAYQTGRGSVTMRAVAHMETGKGNKRSIVFTELPYMVSPDRVAEQVAQHVKDDVLDGIADVRNESDQDGLRLVVELKKDADEEVVLNQLYKHTQLQERQGIIAIAIVNNRPQTLGLKDMLVAYRDHRMTVIRRRTRYLLARAEERAHILEGLLIALDHIDRVIAVIRSSADSDEAARRLREEFGLSAEQAKAILAMRLSQLTGLERGKVEQEHKELTEKIRTYRAILADEQLVLDIIREDLHELKEKYGDARRTKIVGEVGEFDIEDLIADEMVAVVVSHDGYIKRQPVSAYRRQRRGGKGITATGTKEGDFVEHLFIAATLDYMLFFSDQGRCYWLKVYDVPEMGRTARGRAIVNLLDMRPGERIASLIPVRDFSRGDLLMATEKGQIKKTELAAYGHPKKGGIIAINLEEGDRLVDVALCLKEQDVVLATEQGLAVRFKDSAVRATGRATAGVRGVRLQEGDKVVGMVVGEPDATLLSICENGYGKRTRLEDYRLTHRGGRGVINIRTTERNGKVVDVLQVRDDDEVMVVTEKGMLIRMSMENVRVIGRATQGIRLIALNEGDKVCAMSLVGEAPEKQETSAGDEGAASSQEDDLPLPDGAEDPEQDTPDGQDRTEQDA